MESNILESAQEAAQTKEGVSLSLVDDVGEIVLQDSIPDEVTPDITVEDEGEISRKDALKKSSADITTYG